MIYSSKDMTKGVTRADHKRGKGQSARIYVDKTSGTSCICSAECSRWGALTSNKRAVLQYDDETNILYIIPTEETDKITTVAISKAHKSDARRMSITHFLNFVGITLQPGRYLAKGTSDGVEVYLNTKL